MLRNVLATIFVQIWKPNFGHNVEFFFGLWALGQVKILEFKFWQYFSADAWLMLWGLNLDQNSKASYGQDFEIQLLK